MQLTIGRNPLSKVVSIAQSVVPKKASQPILSHLLLEADPIQGLRISGTDEELSYSGVTEAQVETAGRVAVQAQDFFQILKNLPDAPLTLTHTSANEQLEIRSEAIQFQLKTLSAENFPDVVKAGPANLCVYKAANLGTLIGRTIFAVSQEESRYYLGGVFLECKDKDNLRAVATDGHRLALAEADAPADLLLSPGRILPRKLLGELKKMLGSSTVEEISFGIVENRVIFQYGTQTLSGQIVEGSFPDYRQVIPKNPTIRCRLPRQALIEALKRVSLLSPDQTTKGVRFRLQGQILRISSQNQGRGAASEEMIAKESTGEIESAFNAAYFLEALAVLETSDVLLEFTNNLSPCLLKEWYEPAAEEIPKKPYLNVIMPMRL